MGQCRYWESEGLDYSGSIWELLAESSRKLDSAVVITRSLATGRCNSLALSLRCSIKHVQCLLCLSHNYLVAQ